MAEPDILNKEGDYRFVQTTDLHKAVGKYGRIWQAVAITIGSTRTNKGCFHKGQAEVKAG